MLQPFDLERMTLGDLRWLAALERRGLVSVSDYCEFLKLLARCYTGSLADVPIVAMEDLVVAFHNQSKLFWAAMAGEFAPDLPTPDADAILQRLEKKINGGMEQR